MRTLWILAAFAVFVATSLSVSPAAAQSEADKTTARQLFFDALEAAEAKDYSQAADLFRRSNELYPAPTAGVGLARALRDGGNLVEAYEAYNAVVNEGVADDAPDAFVEAIETAKAEAKALEPRLAAVIIEVPCDCSPRVTIDGTPIKAAALGVKRYVNPGTRAIRAEADGFLPTTRELTVAEGGVKTVTLELEPGSGGPAPTPSPDGAPPEPEAPSAADDGAGMRTAGLVVAGLGGVSLVVAAVTGGLYLSDKGTVDDGCTEVPDGRLCSTQEAVDAADRGNTMALINTITLPVGGALVGVGILVFLLAPSDEDAELAVTPMVGPRTAGLVAGGTF